MVSPNKFLGGKAGPIRFRAPTSLSRHNYRVILNAASGNYDEPAGNGRPQEPARNILRGYIPHSRDPTCVSS